MGATRVSVLGPFDLSVDGASVEVGRHQVRSLLAGLAVASGPVSSAVLYELLWAAELPSDPAASLRVAVSRARTALGEDSDSLVHSSGSYELTAWCDAQEFFVDASQLSIAGLRKVLALWRGNPFADLGDSEWFQVEKARLSRARQTIVKTLVSELSAAGRFTEVDRLGREGLELDERDELLAAHVATACARLGRPAEALMVINSCRAALSAAGLEISPPLVSLEHQILHESVEFDAPNSGNGVDQSDAFVGRGAELAAVHAAVGDSRSIGLVGEAGIGKTSLLDVLREQIAGRGGVVVSMAVPQVADRPLHTLAALAEEALDATLAAGSAVSMPHAGALQRIVPQWESDHGLVDPPIDRNDLIARLVDFIAGALSGTTIIVDDWHWIDAVSAEGIASLIASGTCPLVLTSRPVIEAVAAAPMELSAVVEDVIEVAPLDQFEVSELIGKDFPEVKGPVVADIAKRAGGNPLFARLLADLVDDGTDLPDGLPANVLMAIKTRLGVLSPTARRAVEHGAVLGHEFDTDVLAELVGVSVQAGLDEAASAGLLVVDQATTSARFVHSLIADGASQLMSPAQRIALHDSAGRLLERLGAAPAGFASHCVAAAQLDPQRAFDASVAAGSQFLAAYSWDDALRFAETALDLEARGAVVEPRLQQALLVKGRAMYALGLAGSYETLMTCIDCAAEHADANVLVQAMTEICHHGSAVLIGKEIDSAMASLELALAAPVSPALRARLQAGSARMLSYSRHHVRGQTLYKEAFAQFDELDDLEARRSIMRHAEHGLAHPDDHELACNSVAELVSYGESDPELVNHVQWFQLQRAVINADVETLAEAPKHSEEREEHGPRTSSYVMFGQTSGQSMQTYWVQSSIAALAGDAETAEHYADLSLKAGMAIVEARADGFGRGMVLSGYGSLLLAIRSMQNRLGELRPVVEMAIESSPDLPAWKAALCGAAHAEGDHATATELLTQFASNDFLDFVPDNSWTAAMWLLAAPAADVASVGVCEQLYELLIPYQDRMSFTGFSSLGPMHTALALLAARIGREEEADRHLQAATAMTERLHSLASKI